MRAWNEPGPDEDEDALRALARLYRAHPAPEPPSGVWGPLLARVEEAVAAPKGRPKWPIFLGTLAAALAVAASVWLWPSPALVRPGPFPVAPVDDEPFPVAAAREVHIIGMDPSDADRLIVTGLRLGEWEWAASEDIEVVTPGDADEGRLPRLQRGPDMPLIVVMRADDSEEP